MPDIKQYVDIAMARVVLVEHNLVEVRIRSDVRIDVVGLLASMHARRDLIGNSKGPMLFLALGDLDWEPAALQTDFFGQDQENITAVAVMVDSKVLTMVANMYFSLFPARFPTKVFNDEEETRNWLAIART